MAERQWGGKRTPRNPAPVSGPGQLSRRTDGGPQQTQATMTGMPYGENAEFNTLQSQAPMSAAGQTTGRATARQPRGGAQASPMVPLFSPTQRPEEPITDGAPFGPGGGPVFSQPQSDIDDDMRIIKNYLPDLEQATMFRNAPKTFQALVNYLKNA